MSSVEEIREWRKLYPDISDKDGLWQNAPDSILMNDNQQLRATRAVDILLATIAEQAKRIEALQKFVSKYSANTCACKISDDEETIIAWCEAHKPWRDRAEQAEARVKRLVEAARKHRHLNTIWNPGIKKTCSMANANDRELYSVLDEIEREG
jgi:hypothetical protein